MIETMLVIGVGGLLTAGLLAGAGISIAQQRYKESVTGLQAFVQDGYNLTVVSQNSREARWACDEAHVAEDGGGEAPGQSECLVVGRLITISEDSAMKNQSVVAYQKGAIGGSDSKLTDAFSFHVSGIGDIKKSIPWSGWITKPGQPESHSGATILVLRSPISNVVTTYSVDRVVPSSQLNEAGSDALIQESNRSEALDMCVHNESWFAGNPLAVRVQAWAASPSSVFIPDENEDACRA